MTDEDELRHKAQKAKGVVEEKVGEMADDDSMAREGRMDQAKADLKEAGDTIKDDLTG